MQDVRQFTLTSTIGALAGYGVANYLLFWSVPRYHNFFPSLVVTLAASAVVISVLSQRVRRGGVSGYALFIGIGALSSILALYAAVKIGTPAHASVLVVCDAAGSPNDTTQEISKDRDAKIGDWMKRRGITSYEPPPAVWPEHFFVSQEGAVTWIICGEPGTDVEIRFDKNYDPFRLDTDRGPSVFPGSIPPGGREGRACGIITAGPVVRAGRGQYRIIVDGIEIDPGGESPRKGS